MSGTIRREFFTHLKKYNRTGARDYFVLASAVASVISLIILFISSPDIKDQVLTVYIIALLTVCILYIFFRETRKRHRFSSSITYLHFVNHSVRDYLSLLSRGRKVPISVVLTEILDVIAANYSIVTGKPCRASIKDLNKNFEVLTTSRDSISRIHNLPNSGVRHKLSENTDFDELWYGKNGHVRTFIENDLLSRYRRGEYKNSSFKTYGEPVCNPVSNKIIKWTLPYRSTIVWPIRFIENYDEWPPRNKKKHKKSIIQGSDSDPHFWGFLCIDCESRNIFDEFYALELGSAYADVLYILLTQSKEIANSKHNKTNTEQTSTSQKTNSKKDTPSDNTDSYGQDKVDIVETSS